MKAGEKKKYYKAAQRILREEYLDGAIKNGESRGLYSNEQRVMIALKVQGNKGMGYVFDPAHEVKIGRNREGNDICLQDLTVSGNHCKIFLNQGQVYIKDLKSSNGTRIKNGLRSSKILYGESGVLHNGSRIWVGSHCFLLTIFCCDVSAE